MSGYRTAYNGYDLTKKEDQRAWNAVSPALQNLLDQTWNAWGRAGKAEVEEAQAALASTINDAVRFAIQQAQEAAGAQYRLPSATTAGRTWLPSYALPAAWAESSLAGPKLKFSSAYLDKTSSSTAHSYGLEASGSYGLFHASGGVEGEYKSSSAHMQAENFELEAELITASIMRPWFNPLLFSMDGWWVSGYDANALSNGDRGNPKGAIPLIPTGFVLAKNVKISANFSSEDKSFISNTISAKLSGGWGPFSISGRYSYGNTKEDFSSKFDGGSLIFAGLQLIAWISTVTPPSPPCKAK